MSEIYSVSYSPAAQRDIRSIYTYIKNELKATQTAKKQVDHIRAAIKKLNIMPERYEAVDWEPWASAGMRRLPVDRYVVFYLVDNKEKAVIVVRVFYGGRDITDIVKKNADQQQKVAEDF